MSSSLRVEGAGAGAEDGATAVGAAGAAGATAAVVTLGATAVVALGGGADDAEGVGAGAVEGVGALTRGSGREARGGSLRGALFGGEASATTGSGGAASGGVASATSTGGGTSAGGSAGAATSTGGSAGGGATTGAGFGTDAPGAVGVVGVVEDDSGSGSSIRRKPFARSKPPAIAITRNTAIGAANASTVNTVRRCERSACAAATTGDVERAASRGAR